MLNVFCDFIVVCCCDNMFEMNSYCILVVYLRIDRLSLFQTHISCRWRKFSLLSEARLLVFYCFSPVENKQNT